MSSSFELLNTTELNYEIEKMFRSERQFILILSPYLDLTDKIQSILSLSQAKVVIIYREIEKESKKIKIDEFKTAMPKVEFYCIPNFHAKAYITSGIFIVTSLNLYEYSQINNFELGIILKDISYNKMIGKLLEELQILFAMNKIDIKILENLKLPTINDLFKEILVKSEKNEKDYPDAALLKQFSIKMMDRYTFDKNDRWGADKNILQRSAVINRNMYEWALETIRL